MKKMTIVLGLLWAAIFLMNGKAFAEQAEQDEMKAKASAEVSKALVVNNENLFEEEAPVDEELKDEEVVDTDA